ncbi:MAG: CPBP family intramembrane glutamic endopeptidase [Hyphomonadaceae bacterium]
MDRIIWPMFSQSAAFWDIGALVAVLILVALVKAVWVQRVLGLDVRRPPLDDPRVFATEYIMVVTLVPAMTWLLARRGQSWQDLGLTLPSGRWSEFGISALALVVALLVLNGALRALARRLQGRPPRSPYEVIAGRWKPWLVMFVYALLFVGLVEELAFRGFLISRAASLLGGGVNAAFVASVIVALVFGLLHAGGGLLMAVNAAAIGAVLSVVYVASGDLTLVVVAHSIFDAIKCTLYFLRPSRRAAAATS